MLVTFWQQIITKKFAAMMITDSAHRKYYPQFTLFSPPIIFDYASPSDFGFPFTTKYENW